MNYYQNSPDSVEKSSERDSLRFRRSLGYSGDAEYSNAESTTQFRAQNNGGESTNTDRRFQRSIGYTENTGVHTTDFRPQSQSIPQQQTTSSRMMRSFGYYDYNENNRTVPGFSVQEGRANGNNGSNQTRRNNGDVYLTSGKPEQQPEAASSYKASSKPVTLQKEDTYFGNSQYNAAAGVGYAASPYREYPLPDADTGAESSPGAPGTIINLSAAEKKKRSKNEYTEVEFVAYDDGMPHTARYVVNKKRRRFKKLINNLIVIVKAWCTLLCPIVALLLYAEPIAAISFEMHVFLLKSSVVMYPFAVIAASAFDLLTKNEKTRARVLKYETRVSSGENGKTYKYPTLMYYYHNGEYYPVELTLKKEPHPGQLIDIRFDPDEPCDAGEKFSVLTPLIEMLLVTFYIWNVVRVILGWEAGAITNYNND